MTILRTLGSLKKVFAIGCFAALLLSTSSLSYFYWLQEKIHEQERFTKIDAEQVGLSETEGLDSITSSDEHQISLLLKDKSILPEGYQWEEKGREFSYKGMFYDIVSVKHTPAGWVLLARSDEEEAAIVANQNNVHHLNSAAEASAKSSKIKLNGTYAIYETLQLSIHLATPIILMSPKFGFYGTLILNTYSGEITHPPQLV